MERFLWVCLAGALGTGTRYLVSEWSSRAFGQAFPVGTLVVNVVGCFAIALVMFLALETQLVSPTLRVVLTTGFMGGLTTYSAFNYDTTKLLQARAYGAAALNFSLTTGLCLLAGFLGFVVARRFAT